MNLELKTIEDLKRITQIAIDNKVTLGLFIEMPDFPMPELITNPVCNLKKKLEYWEKTYDENLEHRYSKGIKIVDCTFDWTTDSCEFYQCNDTLVKEGD